MKLFSKEWYDTMESFERMFCGKAIPSNREPKELWPKNTYCDGKANQLFQAYLAGYALAQCVYDQGDIKEEGK